MADIAASSFYPTKNPGAYGEAGAVVTGRPELAERVRVMRDLGQTRKYEHTLLGGNDRLDGLQAAVLRVKLRHLDDWLARRRRHARHYEHLLSGVIATLPVAEWAEPAWHLFPIEVLARSGRDRLRSELAAAGITTGVHYPVPLHLQPFMTFLGYRRGDFPVAERRAQTMVSLPMFPELADSEVAAVAAAVRRGS